MQPNTSSRRSGRWLRLIALAFVVICLVVDFLPRLAAPAFRYTGSDPAIPVWNLGWPSTLFIYDPKYGFQVGPSAYLILPFQFIAFAVGLIVVAVVRRLRKQPMQRTGREALS